MAAKNSYQVYRAVRWADDGTVEPINKTSHSNIDDAISAAKAYKEQYPEAEKAVIVIDTKTDDIVWESE